MENNINLSVSEEVISTIVEKTVMSIPGIYDINEKRCEAAFYALARIISGSVFFHFLSQNHKNAPYP